jgi:hypothetical protein
MKRHERRRIEAQRRHQIITIEGPAPVVADTKKVIDLICRMINDAREHVTSEASWERLTEFFYGQLVCEQFGRETVLESVIIVAWAESGHPAADRAIRYFGRKMGERSRFDEMLVSVRSYYLKMAAGKPFVPFPQGRHVVQHLMRDIWLPALVERVAEGTGLERTRWKDNPTPSAAYLIHVAHKRMGIKLGEQEINRIHWRRSKLAAAVEASMPEIENPQ